MAGGVPSHAPTLGPHFFVAAGQVDGAEAVLRDADARHLQRVLRARPGDAVSLADGTGRVWQAHVSASSQPDGAVRLALTEQWTVTPPHPRLVVVHALPKGRKFDTVVRGLSEIGADRLVPVVTERSEVRLCGDRAQRALERWRAVALASAKQARRARPLDITAPGPWPPALADGSVGVVLWEEATVPLASALPGALGGDGVAEVVLAVGPEGGLTAAEVAASRLAVASLGPTILRTETAALVAAALVLARVGRLG